MSTPIVRTRSFWREPNSYWFCLHPILCVCAFVVLFSVATHYSSEPDAVQRMSQIQTVDDTADRLAASAGIAARLDINEETKQLSLSLESGTPRKTLGFSRRPLAHGCANRNQSSKALILKKNENDAFRFSCALKIQEGFLEAPSGVASALPPHLYLVLLHPTRGERDQLFVLQASMPGSWRIASRLAPPVWQETRWRIVLSANAAPCDQPSVCIQNSVWRVYGRDIAGSKENISLLPRYRNL
jgi:hypothetical protein